jgi:hypothetical protein
MLITNDHTAPLQGREPHTPGARRATAVQSLNTTLAQKARLAR